MWWRQRRPKSIFTIYTCEPKPLVFLNIGIEIYLNEIENIERRSTRAHAAPSIEYQVVLYRFQLRFHFLFEYVDNIDTTWMTKVAVGTKITKMNWKKNVIVASCFSLKPTWKFAYLLVVKRDFPFSQSTSHCNEEQAFDRIDCLV